ncbi:Tectonic-3 [Armadillidium vulgare]|nr:Tectonic-3 [Armadillidium vulgare]
MVLIFLIFINFFIPSNLTIFNNSLNNTKKYNESINIEQTIIYNNTSDLEERNFTNTSLNENVTDGNETTTLFPETTESPTTPSSVEDIILDSRIYERNLELQDFCTCDLMKLSSKPFGCEHTVGFKPNNSTSSTKERLSQDSSDDVASTTTSQDLSTANFTGGNTTETNKEEEISSRKLSPEFNSTDYEEYIGEYKLIPITIFICKDLTNEESCTDSKVALNPSNRNGECQHVLKNIHFSVIHNGTYGIEEVVVKIELMRVTDDMKFISQLYKVSFHWVDLNETNVYEKSGSPGYIFGMPVLMGFLQSVENVTEDSEFKEKINLDKNPNNWMTVVGSNGGSECSERVTVKFGINLYSECEINVKLDKNEDICSQLRIKSLLELIGFEYEEENPIRIGMYGDSNILLPVEWVPVILSDDLEHKIITKDNEERSEDFLCSDIVTSIKIEILYASQGPFQNPQSKIIGTLFKLGRSSTLDLKQYQRLDAINSFQNLSIPIELISEVNFVDVTENSKREYPEPPKFDIRLPYDFFYPFLPSGSTQVQSYSDYLVLIISCCFNILIRNACKQ